ncbi:hypothetical protein MARHY0760 [Marinobacter nauticus ATCC 49840]|nr:hypothetical protein MARHY0760 [Marinobacter nauticus ATCC 49840]
MTVFLRAVECAPLLRDTADNAGSRGMQLLESVRKFASKILRKKWLTGQRNDVEYAALIEQQLKRSLKS